MWICRANNNRICDLDTDLSAAEFSEFRLYTAPIIKFTRLCCPLPKNNRFKFQTNPALQPKGKETPAVLGRLRQLIYVTFYVCNVFVVSHLYAEWYHYRWSFLSLNLAVTFVFQLIWVVCMPKIFKIINAVFEFDAKIVGAIGAKAFTIKPEQRFAYKKLKSNFFRLVFSLVLLKFVAALCFVLTRMPLSTAVVLIACTSFDSLPQFVTLCLYVYFSENIRIRFDIMVHFWESVDKTEVQINSYRLLYTQLFHAVHIFNDCFSFPLVALFGTTAYSLFLNFFLLFQYFSFFALISFFLIDIAIIHLLTSYTKDLIFSSEKILRRLLRVTINWYDERKISQIRMFMWELHAKRVKITAFGLFTIDSGLVTSIMLSTASYLVMLFQLMPQLTEEAYNAQDNATTANSTM